YLLYHPFAFTYDLVAATVSLGRWKDWVLSVVPFIEGRRVLEIGHGPGHLQKALLSQKWVAVGLDESAPMGRLARRNLQRHIASTRASSTSSNHDIDYTQTNLARGVSQYLPFHDSSFDTVVATFPTEYIYDPATLQEAYRVLLPAGRLVILPGATIIGRGLLDRAMALLFRITGQTPPNLAEIIHERSRQPFVNAGFRVETHELDVRSSRVYVLVATKSAH
ncbi:MAG TPA: methyltransferase domain-containing protein, partial [Anaerolineales bacterium]|nr:methyltransferase domain-containing protein [Anaerolineales bacterium]